MDERLKGLDIQINKHIKGLDIDHLVAASKKHVAFLRACHKANISLQPPSKTTLQHYEAWLASKALEPPPLDCAWVWHCHRLAPLSYARTAARLGLPDAKSLAFRWTEAATDAGGEPGALVLDGFDVVASCARQKTFLWQVSGERYEDELPRRRARHEHFLRLMRRGEFLVPTYQIDLFWHTHILDSGAAYAGGHGAARRLHERGDGTTRRCTAGLPWWEFAGQLGAFERYDAVSNAAVNEALLAGVTGVRYTGGNGQTYAADLRLRRQVNAATGVTRQIREAPDFIAAADRKTRPPRSNVPSIMIEGDIFLISLGVMKALFVSRTSPLRALGGTIELLASPVVCLAILITGAPANVEFDSIGSDDAAVAGPKEEAKALAAADPELVEAAPPAKKSAPRSGVVY
ncbi:hypothetical protein JL720_13335 [Aureococcus anophagefferens]|nr:hypothetical protein JL720_13335 [Aureococcus anophagefferens]